MAQIDKKWSKLHVCVKDYRDALTKRSTFSKLYEEVEQWIEQKTQLINRLIATKNECRELQEVEFVLTQINQNIDEIQTYSDGKVKYLSQLAVEINAPEEVPAKIKYIVTKNVELKNNLIQLKNDFQEVKFTLINDEGEKVKLMTSQIYHDSEAIEKETPPDFTRKMESAIVLAGGKHCFECVVVGSEPREVKWFKNGVEIFDSETIVTSYIQTTGAISITISNANVSDNGLYACRVSNNMGLAETSAFLKVKGKLLIYVYIVFNFFLLLFFTNNPNTILANKSFKLCDKL